MKKLFVAAAAIAFAVGAQAASIDWSVGANTWTMPDSSKPAKNTVVYLIDAASWSSIETAIKGGATSFTTADAGIIAVGQTSNTKGLVNGGTATSDKLVAGTKYNFAYLVIDSSSDPAQYYASATINMAAYDPTDPDYSEVKTAGFGSAQFTTTGVSGGWATASGGSTPSVPEPTSGLLMLMGLGALALRRRRA